MQVVIRRPILIAPFEAMHSVQMGRPALISLEA